MGWVYLGLLIVLITGVHFYYKGREQEFKDNDVDLDVDNDNDFDSNNFDWFLLPIIFLNDWNSILILILKAYKWLNRKNKTKKSFI